jgi:tRNA(adenine34) deaminase
MSNHIDDIWMQHAVSLAQLAAKNNEVPVGAVLVLDNNIIAEGWNRPISTNDPTAHAEIIALRAGAAALQNYRLLNTTLYVTLEPCAMCVGAIVHARVKRVVFGAYDPKSGAVSSALVLSQSSAFNHQVIYHGGVMADVCGNLLSDFFKSKRC